MFVRSSCKVGLNTFKPIFKSTLNTANIRTLSTSTKSAFGNNNKEKLVWLSKAAACSAILGYTLSEYVFNDDLINKYDSVFYNQLSILLSKFNSLFLIEGNAFSTADHGLHVPEYPWSHNNPFKTFDHAAIRRGYQVYKEVCSACHSMNLIHFRDLVNVSHTENEAKELAAEYEYRDGPDDTGEYFNRPGKLSDHFPAPYANEEAARAANGGAYPPDLSCIVRGRHGYEDYIFSLLLGYCEPPAGITVREGLNYNPYFPGGAIAMGRTIFDESVDYEDGTPTNASQIAKDVTTFLAWASYPEQDERRKLGFKFMVLSTALLGLSIWWKRWKWSYLKSRKVVFKPQNFPKV